MAIVTLGRIVVAGFTKVQKVVKGETTTVNMLSTLLRPTSGSARVAGFDVARDRDSVRKSIGVVFQETALDGKLTGRENLEFHTMMYGIGKTERRRRIDEVLALVELTDKAATLVERYSGGMKRRLEIARGLTHRPKVLFLDEPTWAWTPRRGGTSGTISGS